MKVIKMDLKGIKWLRVDRLVIVDLMYFDQFKRASVNQRKKSLFSKYRITPAIVAVLSIAI